MIFLSPPPPQHFKAWNQTDLKAYSSRFLYLDWKINLLNFYRLITYITCRALWSLVPDLQSNLL